MALIHNIQKGFKSRDNIHKKTECTYFIVYDKLGKKYLQLDTYGSDDRENPGKVSQSLQFSPDALKQLKEVLSKQF